MRYEFKEYIRDEILSNINHMNLLDDALDELDHVYAQAAKADEYEVKAKAFDEMKETASEVLDDIYEREITHADLGYQAIGRELTVIIDNLEKED